MTNVGTTVIAASLMDRAGRKQLLGLSFAGAPPLQGLTFCAAEARPALMSKPLDPY
jgi:hypothetical protein